MSEWMPESNWNKGGQHKQPDWRGDVHKEEPTKKEFWTSKNSQPDNPYLPKVARLEKSLGELRQMGALSEGINAVYDFRLAEVYLEMIGDNRLQSLHEMSFAHAYHCYMGGIEHYREAKEDFDDTARRSAKKHFLRVKDNLGSSDKLSRLFKQCIADGWITQSANTEGIENG